MLSMLLTTIHFHMRTEASLLCESYECLQISGLTLTSDNKSYNGQWKPVGCHNGESYYQLNDQMDVQLCYTNISSHKVWIISDGLCASEHMLAYSPTRGTAEITSTMNNWYVRNGSGWIFDRAVTVTSCSGIRCTICEDHSYNDNICIYSNTLWEGGKYFELYSLCKDEYPDKPIYKYTLYDDNINSVIIYFLHYYEEMMIGKWVITHELDSTNAIAKCEKENLMECNQNTWIVYNNLTNNMVDHYMKITNGECESLKETEPMKTNLFITIIIIIGALLLIASGIIGCFIWNNREKRKLREAIHRQSSVGSEVLIDDEDDVRCNNTNNDELQLNNTHTHPMIEVDVEIEDDEIWSPLNRTQYN